jgi:hypothetical protein
MHQTYCRLDHHPTYTMAYLPTPPSESNVPACEATVYVPTPLHPTAEAEASKRFKHVLRPGVDGLTEADCLARSDAIRESVDPLYAIDISMLQCCASVKPKSFSWTKRPSFASLAGAAWAVMTLISISVVREGSE